MNMREACAKIADELPPCGKRLTDDFARGFKAGAQQTRDRLAHRLRTMPIPSATEEEREELATILREYDGVSAYDFADAILAAGWRPA